MLTNKQTGYPFRMEIVIIDSSIEVDVKNLILTGHNGNFNLRFICKRVYQKFHN